MGAVAKPREPEQKLLTATGEITQMKWTGVEQVSSRWNQAKEQEIYKVYKVYTGLEWMMRERLKKVAHTAVEVFSLTEGADQWEEWNLTISKPSTSNRGPPSASNKIQEGRKAALGHP